MSRTSGMEAGLFHIGDKVVYPHHGAGTVVKKEKREVLGETREYLTIQILHNDMTVNVPCDNAERVGLRQVIDQRTVAMVVRTLSGGSTEMPKNWNRRFKHNRDKMKTGNIFELAEVVRNLAVRNNEKGLSTGEKQMFVKAKKILASELMATTKVGSCVTGGSSRAASVAQALAEVPEEALVVLVHDAARPLVDDAVVERVLEPLSRGFDGAVPALPVSDTLKRVEGDVVVETVSRDAVVRAQTPQAFLAPVLRRALEGDVDQATDCASLVERAGGRVAVVEGDPRLVKVTTPDDLSVVEALLPPA